MNPVQRLTSGLTLVAVLAVPCAITASAATAGPRPGVTDCAAANDDAWPTPVAGRPSKLEPLALSGLYYWHDSTGWHLRVTHESTSLQTFTGTIYIDTGKMFLDKVVSKSTSRVSVAADRKSLTYTINNRGKIDGFDFRTKCARHMVTGAKVKGKRVNTIRIYVGKKNFHPNHNPFRFSAR